MQIKFTDIKVAEVVTIIESSQLYIGKTVQLLGFSGTWKVVDFRRIADNKFRLKIEQVEENLVLGSKISVSGEEWEIVGFHHPDPDDSSIAHLKIKRS